MVEDVIEVLLRGGGGEAEGIGQREAGPGCAHQTVEREAFKISRHAGGCRGILNTSFPNDTINLMSFTGVAQLTTDPCQRHS